MCNIVKVVNEDYTKPDALVHLIYYILRNKNTGGRCRYCGGANIDINNAENEIMYIKKRYRKTSGRQARHFIVSLGDEYDFTPYELNEIAMQICGYYMDRFQIMYSVHEDTANLHIHFAMNTVSYIDGKMFSEGPADFQKFKNYVHWIVSQYH